MAIDPEKKLNSYGKGKYLLRKAFEGDWLPPEILWREKAAFSDAVGHSMVDDIKEYAESLYTDEEFQLRRANYSAHCMPFTKESTTTTRAAPSWTSGCPTRHGRAATSTTPPPACWQTTALRACKPPRPAGYLAEFRFLLDVTLRIEHRTLCGVRLSCGVGTPQMTRTSQTLRSSNLRRYYIKYSEHRKMFYHSSAAVRGSQSRHAFPAFPGACCFYSDVVFQLPEVASASAPTRTAKPPRTPRAIFTSSASICS